MTAKLKPAIFYTLEGGPHARRWSILAVTTETKGRRAQLYGRDEHGNPTHTTPEHVAGRFATLELAKAGQAVLHQIVADWAEPIAKVERELSRLKNSRYAAITGALADIAAQAVEPIAPEPAGIAKHERDRQS